MARMKFQGVANVLRFNWHYYLYALIFAVAAATIWRVLLKPGEGKTLTYRYERFVPSH